MKNNELNLIGSDMVAYDKNNKDIYTGTLEDIKVIKTRKGKDITFISNDSKEFKDTVLEESYRDRRKYNVKSICEKEL